MNQPMGGTPNPSVPTAPPVRTKRNVLELIALAAGTIGFVFACVPGVLIIGWVLLLIALILGIGGVCLPGRTKSTSVVVIVVSVVGIVVGSVYLGVVTHGFSDALGKSGSGASDRKGGRNNPFQIGQEVTNGDWQVTLGPPHEAWTQIAAESQLNTPPEPGMEYWIVPVTATYVGDKTGWPLIAALVGFVDSDNRSYNGGCGIIPNALASVSDRHPGGTAQGNLCLAVPSGADGLWTLKTARSNPVFFKAR